MEWEKQMSVGVAEFDQAHRDMIDLLTRIHEALGERQVETAVALAEQLLAVATAHVDREEAFLRTAGYPEVEMVIGTQRDSLGRIRELARLLTASPATADEAILEMKLNFIDYLLRGDINFKSFVKAAGLSDC